MMTRSQRTLPTLEEAYAEGRSDEREQCIAACVAAIQPAMIKNLSADYTAELRGPLNDDVMQRLAKRNAARLEQLRRKK